MSQGYWIKVSDKIILDGAVKTRHIDDRAIVESKIADGAVSTRTIADLAVTNAKIDDFAVSNIKLADGAVTTRNIVDRSIIEAKLADGCVSYRTLVDRAVDDPKLALDSVRPWHINIPHLYFEWVEGTTGFNIIVENGIWFFFIGATLPVDAISQPYYYHLNVEGSNRTLKIDNHPDGTAEIHFSGMATVGDGGFSASIDGNCLIRFAFLFRMM